MCSRLHAFPPCGQGVNAALESALKAEEDKNSRLEVVYAASKKQVELHRKLELFVRPDLTRLQPIPG